MKTIVSKYLTLSGTGNVNFQVPGRGRLLHVILALTALSTSTAAQVNAAQCRLSAATVLGSSGDDTVIAAAQVAIGGLTSEGSNVCARLPHITFEKMAVLSLVVVSGTGCTAYADALFILEIA